MRHMLKSVTAALVIGAGFGGAAQAEGEFSGSVALTSDYIYRGVTQADGAPVVSGSFDYATDSFYVGTWASGVDFGDGTSTEIDLYAGWTPSVGRFDLDIGAIYYFYPDAPDNPEQNFLEVYAGFGTTIGEFVDVGASFAYSPDFYYESGSSLYSSFSAGIPLGESFGLDASVGFSDFYDDGNDNYTDYSLGLTTSVEGFDLDFRAIATSGLDGNDEAFVITVGRSM